MRHSDFGGGPRKACRSSPRGDIAGSCSLADAAGKREERSSKHFENHFEQAAPLEDPLCAV